MEIEHLHEFHTIAKLGSYTLASEELFIVQSALSKHIKALENELGIQLFDRSSRQIQLTDAGKLLVPIAEEIYLKQQEFLNKIETLKTKAENTINVATIPVMVQYSITETISEFTNEYPGIIVNLFENEPTEIPRCLDAGLCDFAFMRDYDQGKSGYETIPYYEDHLVAVLPRKHPLATKGEIDLYDLHNESFMFLDQATILFDICVNLCKQAGFTPKVTYSGRRPGNIIEMVSLNMGVGILMDQHVNYKRHKGIAIVNISPTFHCPVSLVKQKSKMMTPAGHLFWNYIRDRE